MKAFKRIGQLLSGSADVQSQLRRAPLLPRVGPLHAEDDEEFERTIKADEVIDERIAALALPHLKTFARKYHQLVVEDDYGTKNTAKWQNELGYFVETAIMRDDQVISALQVSPKTKDRLTLALD